MAPVGGLAAGDGHLFDQHRTGADVAAQFQVITHRDNLLGRSMCLDQAWRPLRDLEKLSHCACRLKRWQTFAWQLATCELLPSISHSDLVQGSSDE